MTHQDDGSWRLPLKKRSSLATGTTVSNKRRRNKRTNKHKSRHMIHDKDQEDKKRPSLVSRGNVANSLSVYSGEVNTNNLLPNGHGVLATPDGDTMAGNWSNGKQSGHGTYDWQSGSHYKGEFRHGNLHGHGCYKWPRARQEYEGGFKDGLLHGYGEFKYSDGFAYHGQYVNGKKHGHGVLFDADGFVVHEGQWKDNKPEI